MQTTPSFGLSAFRSLPQGYGGSRDLPRNFRKLYFPQELDNESTHNQKMGIFIYRLESNHYLPFYRAGTPQLA